jgi:hypothetical protein
MMVTWSSGNQAILDAAGAASPDAESIETAR